jgi:Ras family
MIDDKQICSGLLRELYAVGCVGKTSLVVRYVENEFYNEHRTTVQAAFFTKRINIAGQRATLAIWVRGHVYPHSVLPFVSRFRFFFRPPWLLFPWATIAGSQVVLLTNHRVASTHSVVHSRVIALVFLCSSTHISRSLVLSQSRSLWPYSPHASTPIARAP